jgi:hypothetical protein
VRQKVEGLDAMLADLARQTREELPTILRLFAEEATKDVRAAWPTDTGRSAAALTVTTSEGEVAIECNVPYASFIYEKGLVGPTWMVRIVDFIWQRSETYAARVSRRIAERR